jgi:phosphopantothenoylcysteine decarboxylase/phosphopantothenate--cysteine ligase
MGIALALEAKKLGANVTLILGPITGPAPRARKNLQVVRVISAKDMEQAVMDHLPGTQVFVGAAAVSDYRPEVASKNKLKDRDESITLRLVRNPDIIAKVARRSPRRPPVVIGFALETQDLIENAQEKLKRKGLDWIVANRETNLGTANGSAVMFSRWQERIPLGKMPKTKLAKQIWKAFLARPAL